MKHLIQEQPTGGAPTRHVAVDTEETTNQDGDKALWTTIFVDGRPLISHVPSVALFNTLKYSIEEAESGEPA